MDKIEIGEYIRTKKGNIAKVCAYQDLITYDNKDTGVTFHSFDTDKGAIADIEIAKHSKDIKKIVETGDVLVFKIGNMKAIRISIVNIFNDARSGEIVTLVDGYKLEQIDILSILTKEQYKQNCYKVEE